MNFTTPILFTPKDEVQRREFIEHLEKIGYNESAGLRTDGSYIHTCTRSNSWFAIHLSIAKDRYCDDEYYDCGSNLELAKALSALRDDSGPYQWYIRDIDGPDAKWICNPHPVWIGNPIYRKATPEELIERFKDKGK